MRREFTRTVKLAAWDRAGGCCEACGKKLFPGDRREYDHIIPDAVRPDNSAENCQLLCGACHTAKTKKDRKDIAKCNRVRAKQAGAHRPKSRLTNDRWKRKVSGETVPRETRKDDDALGEWF